MEKHFELNDVEFAQQFEDYTLPPEIFTHEAHLRLAWIHIKNHGVEKAIAIIRDQIQHYAASLGAHDKYHETITVASVQAVSFFISKSASVTFYDFITENQQLKTHFKQLLATHYSTDIFHSEEAKKTFLKPDLDSFE
jgi:N-formylglutamate deformylase